MFSLKNKTALITGASRGIGRGIAIAMAKAGADIIINYRQSEQKAKEVAEEIQAMDRKATIIQGDVSSEKEVARLFKEIESTCNRLDILVNNAGTSQSKDIFNMTLEDWNAIIHANLTSTFLCSKAAVELMRKNSQGRIISISSVVAEQGALYGHVHYASTKSGQLGFTKTLARTAAQYGITVNAITPGVIETELSHATLGQETYERLNNSILLGIGSVSDIGHAAVFLASDEAGYITGITLDVNGGLYMH